MCLDLCWDIQFFKHLLVALEYLDSIPALLLLGHIVEDSFFYVGDSVFNRAAERVLRDSNAVLCSIYGSLRSFVNSRPLQSGYLDYLTSEPL